MPPSYRGDIVFVNDAQNMGSLDNACQGFSAWADEFSDNMVMFQIGYEDDSPWWQGLNDPPRTIGDAIAASIGTPSQQVGIIWVDFTINRPEVSDLLAPIEPTAARNAEIRGNSVRSETAAVVRTSSSALRLKVARQGTYDVGVFSLDGRLVKSYRGRKLVAGENALSWNRTDIGNAMYFVTLTNKETQSAQRVFVK
jgi:hypothetical protein